MTTDPESFLKSAVNYLDILKVLDEGVIITDHAGRIMFINDAQAMIDDCEPEAPIGKTPDENWDITTADSPIMKCLRSGRPIVNSHIVYKTRTGRRANTIESIYPLVAGEGDLIGSISFVREYNILEDTITSIYTPPTFNVRSIRGNGARFKFEDIIGDSEEFQECVKTAKMASLTPSPVMIIGETGTGKELFAQAIHNFSPRQRGQFVGLNCAAIPEHLLEGILFGTTRGAFTGAVDKPGLIEKSDRGTLFLDEINSMPAGLQAKILRATQEKVVRRVGSLEEREVDPKILSSVNEDPHQAIEAGRLRRDLFYRLGVVLLYLPRLRDREGDIDLLTDYFIRKYDRTLGRRTSGLNEKVRRIFNRYSWPGNIRELEHVIEGALNVLGPAELVEANHLPPHLTGRAEPHSAPPPTRPAAVEEASAGPLPAAAAEMIAPERFSLEQSQTERERAVIARALRISSGNITQAGRLLGMSRQRLSYRMKKHGLARAAFKD